MSSAYAAHACGSCVFSLSTSTQSRLPRSAAERHVQQPVSTLASETAAGACMPSRTCEARAAAVDEAGIGEGAGAEPAGQRQSFAELRRGGRWAMRGVASGNAGLASARCSCQRAAHLAVGPCLRHALVGDIA